MSLTPNPIMMRPRSANPILRSAALVMVFAACASDGDSSADNTPTTPGPTRPDTLDVFTPGNLFSPTSAEIRVGGTIRWRISESPDGRGHNVVFSGNAPGKPADIPIVKGVTVPRTFSRTGTFPYTCTIHPGMDGDVVVR
jgi:plastocyanin